MMDAPILAVYMITYNHQDYIDQAIESVIGQITNFNFKLFIGDDASSDDTFKKCLIWKERYPHKIVLLNTEKNLGVFDNANRVFTACIQSGAKYIALLEGDDYWSDLNKLQRQVDILESDENIAGSYHNTEFLYKDGERKPMKKSLPLVLELKEVISKYAPFHTSSFVFRAKDFCRPSWFQKIDSVDLAMYVWHAQFGRFEGINEVMSTYRIHSSSLTASESHKNYFHDKRVILHRMMQGKINHQYFEKYRDLIRFHEEKATGIWKKEVKRTIFFFMPVDGKSKDMMNFRMSLDAQIVNVCFEKNARLKINNRSYPLSRNFRIWNRFQWKRSLRNLNVDTPDSLVFFQEKEFNLFIEMFGAMSLKLILLFPFDSNQLEGWQEMSFDLTSVDWMKLDNNAKNEWIMELNCES